MKICNQKEGPTRISQWYWQRKFNRTYDSQTGMKGDPSQLRLILGVHSSGVDWLCNLITPMIPTVRYYNEPVFRMEPHLPNCKGKDHTAMPYCVDLPDKHPLIRCLRSLVEKDSVWGSGKMNNRITTKEIDWKYCLVKESHCLLASEAILNQLLCPVLFIHRDPAQTVDRVFKQEGTESGYLDNERKAILHPEFLARFLPNDFKTIIRTLKRIRKLKTEREQYVLETVLTVALIGRMFYVLSARYPKYAQVIRYETASRNPHDLGPKITKFLGEQWADQVEKALFDQTPHGGGILVEGEVDHSVRKTLQRPFTFLPPNEVECCRNMLSDCGLDEEYEGLDPNSNDACSYVEYQATRKRERKLQRKKKKELETKGLA